MCVWTLSVGCVFGSPKTDGPCQFNVMMLVNAVVRRERESSVRGEGLCGLGQALCELGLVRASRRRHCDNIAFLAFPAVGAIRRWKCLVYVFGLVPFVPTFDSVVWVGGGWSECLVWVALARNFGVHFKVTCNFQSRDKFGEAHVANVHAVCCCWSIGVVVGSFVSQLRGYLFTDYFDCLCTWNFTCCALQDVSHAFSLPGWMCAADTDRQVLVTQRLLIDWVI